MHRPTEAEVAQEMLARLKARITRDGIRIEKIQSPTTIPTTLKDEDRRQRSLRSCHLPADPNPGAYNRATAVPTCRRWPRGSRTTPT